MAARPIYRCRCHDQAYTVCPACDHQSCATTWPRCPRCGAGRQDRVYRFPRALRARAEREGWGIFNDTEVQRLDDDDAGRGYLLPDDAAAVQLARLAGVPVRDDGTLDCDALRYSDT